MHPKTGGEILHKMLTLENFKMAVNELYFYFRMQSMPPDEVIKLWHKDIQHIPSPAMDHILKFIKDKDNMPRNLPKAFKAGWFDFIKNNQKQVIVEREPCNDCGGDGLHYVRVFGYNYVQPCHCINSKRHLDGSIRRMSRRQLEDAGFEYMPLPTLKRRHDNVEQMAEDITDEVPF